MSQTPPKPQYPAAVLVTDHELTGDILQQELRRHDFEVDVHPLEVMAIDRLNHQPPVNVLIIDTEIKQIQRLLMVVLSLPEAPRLVALMRNQGQKPDWAADGILSPPFAEVELRRALGPFAKTTPAPRRPSGTMRKAGAGRRKRTKNRTQTPARTLPPPTNKTTGKTTSKTVSKTTSKTVEHEFRPRLSKAPRERRSAITGRRDLAKPRRHRSGSDALPRHPRERIQPNLTQHRSQRDWSSNDSIQARRHARGSGKQGSLPTPLPTSGTFDGMPLSSVLFKLFIQRRTGLLTIKREGYARRFCFKKGECVGMGGVDDRDTLAESLVKLGFVAFSELMEMLRSSTDLGAELLNRGLVTQEQLLEARSLQSFDLLVNCFAWHHARYIFLEGEDVWVEIEPLNALQVIYEGLCVHPGFEVMSLQLSERAEYRIARTERLHVFADYLPDEPWIKAVLDASDGRIPLEELVSLFPDFADECIGLIYLLLEGKMLELLPITQDTLSRHNPINTGNMRGIPMDPALAGELHNPGTGEALSSSRRLSHELRTRPRENIFVQGDVISDRYEIEEIIGEGSTAMVYRVGDLELEEKIALKIFHAGEYNPEYLPRFRQELSIARSLAHPNIIRVYDINTWHGLKYITMELLEGEILHHRMESPLDLSAGLGYLIQACHGLQAAHEQNIIHRDVKPENFFITTKDTLKVMDFGIAKRISSRMTLIGFAAGTPAYMSPEQIETFTSVTARSDIYALGVVAYEMFTGELPFWDDDLETLLKMHLQDPPVAPIEHRPDLPIELNALILQLMSKNPDERVQTCRELADLFGLLRDSHQVEQETAFAESNQLPLNSLADVTTLEEEEPRPSISSADLQIIITDPLPEEIIDSDEIDDTIDEDPDDSTDDDDGIEIDVDDADIMASDVDETKADSIPHPDTSSAESIDAV